MNELVSLTASMKIIIKKPEKEIIFTIMYPEFGWNMCNTHISITEYYKKVVYSPKTISQGKLDNFIQKN